MATKPEVGEVVGSPWFNWHTFRFACWVAQIPIALLTPLKNSIAYLCFLSIAALVESSGTDVLAHVKGWREAQRTRVIEADPEVVKSVGEREEENG